MDQPKTLLRVALMTITLGIVIESSQFILAVTLDNDSRIKLFIADFTSKFSWTYIVCTAIALANALTKNAVKTGLAGLISVPIGLYLAMILHKAALNGMDLDEAAAGKFLIVPVMIKAVEYALLGIFLVFLINNNKKFSHFVFTGLLTGIFFGMCQVIFKTNSTPAAIPFIKLLPLCLNELIIPVGCSIIIYSSDVLAGKLKNNQADKLNKVFID